jgi:hypothetical protein
MSKRTHRTIAGFVALAAALAPAVLFGQPASAFNGGKHGDPVHFFKYKLIATTLIKRSNLIVEPQPGIFRGAIDLKTGELVGDVALPSTTFTQTESGVGTVTTTSETINTKLTHGHVNLKTFQVTATSTFNIHIISMYPAGTPPLPPPFPPVNLVGDSCMTTSPITVTMSGKANLAGTSTFTGVFTIPGFWNCQGMTDAINQQIPGPGNTFTATVSPS